MLKVFIDKRIKLRTILAISLLLCSIALLIKVTNRIDILPQGDTYKLLEQKYGDNYPNILSFESVSIGSKDLLILNVYKPKQYDLSFLIGNTKEEKLNSIIGHVEKIPYSEYQNNPNKSSEGLNCQGYALMIRDMCKQIDVPCEIVYTTNHMYNIVKLNNFNYKLDVVNGIMEKIN